MKNDERKKNLCFANFLIAAVLVLILVVYISYGYGKKISFIGQWIPICIYVIGILLTALVLWRYPYHPRKGLLFGAVYSLLFDLIIFVIIPLVQLILGEYQGMWTLGAVPWIVTLGTALISGLFFWAAFIRED